LNLQADLTYKKLMKQLADSPINTRENAKDNKTKNELFVKVAVDLPISASFPDEGCYFYRIPDEFKNEIYTGTIVQVPFGNQEIKGYVLDITDLNSVPKNITIKSIYDVISSRIKIDENFIELITWISKYYLTNTGIVISASINAELYSHESTEIELLKSDIDNNNLTKEENFIITKLNSSKTRVLSYKFLHNKSRISKERFYRAINHLIKKGFVSKSIKHTESRIKDDDSMLLKAQESSYGMNQISFVNEKIPLLNKEQQSAIEKISPLLNTREHNTFLIHGVTGSGKTEIYLNLINECIKLGRSAIYLVPEIYLVPQAYSRLASRFKKESIVIWHSSLNKTERLANLEKLQKKEPVIILGARSGVLAPVSNIGLIVIDEAHDGSYKQASPAPRYNAIKVAIKRGEIEKCPVVLGTATPNVSDYYFCERENTVIELPERIDNVPMPEVKIIDLTQEYSPFKKNSVTKFLSNSINQAIERKEQIILLLNRRGHSSHIFCRSCGYIQLCKNCSVPVVYHKNKDIMVCHHCGYTTSSNKLCPQCNSAHYKHYGIGTQQLEEEARKTFPEARIMRVDKDQLSRKNEYIRFWNDFASHKADILIGTQIVAKGLDLKDLTVVGVVLADTTLNFPDYIASERTFQLLTQVTGRAGRGQKKGNVFIQTYQAENPLFKFIQEHDYKGFYNSEIKQRMDFNYPPFTTLSRIIFQSYDETECINYANNSLKELLNINNEMCEKNENNFLGPAPCFFTKLHGKYRYHILCKIKNEEKVSSLFSIFLKRLKRNSKVELIIDIDSVNLL